MGSRPVLIGDDGAAAGRDAIALGRLLAGAMLAPADVVTVDDGGDLALALDLSAEESDAALLVVGAAMGAVSAQLLAYDARPIAVAPAGFAERSSRMRRVGVGHGDAPAANKALRFARDAFDPAATSLCVFDVRGDGPPRYGVPAGAAATLEQERARVRRTVTGLPASTEVRLLDGPLGDGLAAASEEADVLVIGSLGRETTPLIERLSCPAVVVPA